MKIAVIGTGYVGLVAGVCFADTGHDVACVDIDPDKIASLRKGEVPIFEPGLSSLLERAIREGRISFTEKHAEAVPGAEVVFIAVGTPEGPDGAPIMDYCEAAVKDSIAAADGPLVLVMKSTVPVGTAAWLRDLVKDAPYPVEVVSNPEFLKEGDAVSDFMKPDRVVIGTQSDEAWETMKDLYTPFVRSGKPILRVSNVTAEIVKYAANAMLATRISFMNEIAQLCDRVGANVRDVASGIGSDSRIGKPFLHAGCGYGGSCFPKDTQGLIHVARDAGVDMQIVTAAEKVNDEQKSLLVKRVVDRFGEDLSGRKFALWGLAFKPQTDDVREAPALVIARGLLDRGATVVGTDPEALETFRAVFGEDIAYTPERMEAVRDVDALVLCTEWNEYRGVDFTELGDLMKHKVIFDGRNIYDAEKVEAAGFEYEGIGLGRRLSSDAEPAVV